MELVKLEPFVISAIEDARTLRLLDDGSSATERSLRAWWAYDEAVELARGRLAIAIHPQVHVESVPLELIEDARTRARVLAGEVLRHASVACANATVGGARPRWVSLFNRKS